MKTMAKNGFLMVLFLFSCEGMRKSTIAEPNLKRAWMLTAFSSYSKEYLMQKKASLDLKTQNASAYMGCNSMTFEFERESSTKIRFQQGISTEMACEDMKLESDFAATLPSMIQYKVEGHQLTLLSKEGAKMTFIAADWD